MSAPEKNLASSHTPEDSSTNSVDYEKRAQASHVENTNASAHRKLANPLAGLNDKQILEMADKFARDNGLEDIQEVLRKGALVSRDPAHFEGISSLTEEEKVALRREWTHKWHLPRQLWLLVVACSMAAVVQGQDQSLINGANLFWPEQFGVGGNSDSDVWIVGLVNAAPYFACALFACWLTDPLNHFLGRKGTILVTLIFATFPCVWAACTNSWQNLFAARVILSIGIGPKSSTVPIFAAESVPPAIRGALVMMWQMWTAFGIMIGYVCNLMFYHVKDTANIRGLNWRLMLGSGCVPPIIVFAQVIFVPESPRWLLLKNRPRDAYNSLLRLRHTPLQAARDLFYISVALEAEKSIHTGNKYLELFTKPRVRRATLGAFIVMFMQQFCGINVIAYFSSQIFRDAGLGDLSSIIGSWGFGMLNFVFAIPGMFTIDTFGRRALLLTTFPIMGLCLFFTGSMFYVNPENPTDKGRVAGILLGVYLFCMAYSPGEGPVPFTYSAEAFPLYIRPVGMSFATAVCWLFNGVLGLTWPPLQKAFTIQGAFYWYATWNFVGFFLALCFVPETKALSLEELDQVFEIPTRHHAAWGLRQIPWFIQSKIFRRDVPKEELYEVDPTLEKTYAPKAGGH
ncbi:hypothetical protein AAF712_013340 [Marasmius tenuissimus]|uniref:Major facilitator superfamily (MFS) profile domain-containing protein n=1 Tax=Marasmius tenuissimus TaxID=585030 RepID=A0ABR2ZEU0_9AGAR|nr:hypothetical protein PM082_005766 [Marasmius tenuissimus]